jgi:hypothetical protein
MQVDGPRLRIEVVGIEKVEEPKHSPTSAGGKTVQPLREELVDECIVTATAADRDSVEYEEGHLTGFESKRFAERMYELGTERAVNLTVVGIFGAAVFFGLGAASLRWGNPGDLRAVLQVVLPPASYLVGLAVLKNRLPWINRRKAKRQD